MASISLREAILNAQEIERDTLLYPGFTGHRQGEPFNLWEVKQLLDMLGFRGERTRLMAMKALAKYNKLKNHGIYSRVVWNYKQSKWEYQDGQDGLAERKIVRELLVKAGEQL